MAKPKEAISQATLLQQLAKEQAAETQPPVKVSDSTEVMKTLLAKKKTAKTTPPKTATKSKATKSSDHPHVKDPGYWSWYYRQPGVKQKYLAWSKKWRDRKRAEKLAAEQKSKKSTKKTAKQ